MIIVVDCTEKQHKANLNLSGVEELSETDAIKLAARYQPERTVTRFDPTTMKEEKITIPACDLKKFIEKKEKK